ncbi:hypothetical protein D1872_293630 [compost metagenome]
MEYEFVEVGPCPACGAPGDYKYKLKWPGESERDVLVTVSFQCPVCGYTINSEKILIPLKALYLMRNMLLPRLRPVVEKMYLASKLSLEKP